MVLELKLEVTFGVEVEAVLSLWRKDELTGH